MDERQRFTIAVGGVLGGFGIAAAVILTAPREVALPAVAGRAAAAPEPLAAVQMPASTGEAGSTPGERRRSVRRMLVEQTAPVTPTRFAASDTVAAEGSAVPSPASRWPAARAAAPMALSTGTAPDARSRPLEAAPGVHPRERGAVAGALATAGTHIEDGFRTAGRALRRAF